MTQVVNTPPHGRGLPGWVPDAARHYVSHVEMGQPIRALVSAASAPQTLYAALSSGVWTSRDAGVVWSRLAPGDAVSVAVHPTNPDYIFAAVDGGLKQSRDGGTTWSALAAI